MSIVTCAEVETEINGEVELERESKANEVTVKWGCDGW
jgi:hypothetical protein